MVGLCAVGDGLHHRRVLAACIHCAPEHALSIGVTDCVQGVPPVAAATRYFSLPHDAGATYLSTMGNGICCMLLYGMGVFGDLLERVGFGWQLAPVVGKAPPSPCCVNV